jgi:glycosyltransferase involved in cell wall biosynthesis
MSIAEDKGPKRLKVLVSCYACDPTMGSEPGMGGNWVLQLAQHHDLWVLTEENRFAPALADYLERHRPELKSAIQIIGIPRHRYGEKLWGLFFYYWTYRSWQKAAYQMAQHLLRQVNFDLSHQLNMIGYREPGYLWKLPIPFLWGPIGGHAQMPWRFLSIFGPKGLVQYGLRNLLNGIQMRTFRRVKQAMQRADLLLAATTEDQESIRRMHRRKAVLLREVGTDPLSLPATGKPYDKKRPLRVVWVGIFVARKALPLALMAVQRVGREVPVQLHIVGSGICEGKWKSLAEQMHVSSQCHWYGNLPHNQALEIIRQSDVMLFTSLQEATATVVVEALQYSVPVICHDLCGFGTLIDETCGIKIPARNPRLSCNEFAEAVERLARNPELLQALSHGASQRAREMAWPNQTKTMLDCYQEAIQIHSERAKLKTTK